MTSAGKGFAPLKQPQTMMLRFAACRKRQIKHLRTFVHSFDVAYLPLHTIRPPHSPTPVRVLSVH